MDDWHGALINLIFESYFNAVILFEISYYYKDKTIYNYN